MKRKIAMFLFLTLTLTLTACQGTEQKASSSDDSGTVSEGASGGDSGGVSKEVSGGNSEAIGIVASLDPVAADQACIDLAFAAEGSAAAFMITGPATKITNLGALKIVLGAKRFFLYIAFAMMFSLVTGLITNLIV